MAQAAVDIMIGKIVCLIENEALLIGGISDELEEIKIELKFMRSFLEDASAKRGLSRVEQTWVDCVRDAFVLVEDIIDEYVYYKNKELVGGKLKKLLHQILYLPLTLLMKHRIGMKLKKINRRIGGIHQITQRYGIDRVEGTSSISDDSKWMKNNAESSLYFKDEDLVGIEDQKESILKWLMDQEGQRKVLTVVGMGGSGKTTLVSNVFNNQTVKRRFGCYAWITVSQNYAIEELLRRMIEEFFKAVKEAVPSNLSTMEYRGLIDVLVNFLATKRYVVILDDVWSIKLWEEIKLCLPDNGLASRVMLTTRNQEIAAYSFGVRSDIHPVKALRMDEAMKLFCMKAFSSDPNRCCPDELQAIAMKLVEKCEGLPLAIVALAGAMSPKKLESEWRKVNDSLDFELRTNPNLQRMRCILLLSFHDLPYQLKHCFLYCSLFPEDYLIRHKRLIRLWIAEGFIKKDSRITLEEIAESYLSELISRGTLQVVSRNVEGQPKRFKMHDLLREIALSISMNEKLGKIYDGQVANEETTGARRLFQTNRMQLNSWKDMLQLRSVLIFGNGIMCPSIETLPSRCRLLRVLDLQKVEIVKLPDGVTELYNLRYLNLKRTKLKELPKSIGRLRNLLTLDITKTDIRVLPIGITKVENLRHLRTNCYNPIPDKFEYYSGTQVPASICKLQNMQDLYYVEANVDLIKQLRHMTQLKRFGITKVEEEHQEDLCTAIQNMNCLSNLCVSSINEDQYLRMDAPSFAPPSFLKNLFLGGKLERLPKWFHLLKSLTVLRLNWSRLTKDPLVYIGQLPNLGKLTLRHAYMGTRLHFTTGFQKLKELDLIYFPMLNEIVIEKGAMPGLQQLYLSVCSELRMLPHGIESLSHLENLYLSYLSKDLVDTIRGEHSADWSKVQHIPQIHHFYRSPNGDVYESLSITTSLP